jgi:hypothetical protein
VAKRPMMNNLRNEFRRKGGGSRHTALRVLGGKLDRYGVAFNREQFHFEDAKDGARVIEVAECGTCSFGHTVDDKVRVAGICEIGGEVLCSTEGCMRQCVHCGAVVCRRHSRTFGEETYCRRHMWVHWWRAFWRLD